MEIIPHLLRIEFFVNKELGIHYKTTNLRESAGFNFSDLFLFQSFLKIFSVFLSYFSFLSLQKIRFTINYVLSPPVIKNFCAVTLFLVTHYAV